MIGDKGCGPAKYAVTGGKLGVNIARVGNSFPVAIGKPGGTEIQSRVFAARQNLGGRYPRVGRE